MLNREKEVTGIYISGHPLDDYRLELEHFITCTLDKTAQYQHKPLLQLAGMVTHATHKISKNGNGWGVFSITDYQGALEFRLFGDDYQKFKHLLAEGMVIFIKGRFQRSWRSEEELELKITEIRLLEGIGQDLTEGITLKVPVDFLSAPLIAELDAICQANKGPHKLRVELIDPGARIKVGMISTDRKVNADSQFTKALARIGIEFTLN